MNSAEKTSSENPSWGIVAERAVMVRSGMYTSYPCSRNHDAHPLPPSGLFRKFYTVDVSMSQEGLRGETYSAGLSATV